MNYYIVEASHLFRAGDKFQTQFFVVDVVGFLNREYFDSRESKTIVLHGSVKAEQADRYAAALERHDVRVIRMKPIASMTGNGKWYFKPTWYCHRMMGTDIPKGNRVVLVGFHNPRYKTFIEKYVKDFEISMAAFKTPSKKQGWMSIPEDFKPLLKHAIDLDECAAKIKAEFRRNRSSK